MKDYEIIYSTSLGECSLLCYQWELGAVLWSLFHMAMRGFKLSNVTIIKR